MKHFNWKCCTNKVIVVVMLGSSPCWQAVGFFGFQKMSHLDWFKVFERTERKIQVLQSTQPAPCAPSPSVFSLFPRSRWVSDLRARGGSQRHAAHRPVTGFTNRCFQTFLILPPGGGQRLVKPSTDTTPAVTQSAEQTLPLCLVFQGRLSRARPRTERVRVELPRAFMFSINNAGHHHNHSFSVLMRSTHRIKCRDDDLFSETFTSVFDYFSYCVMRWDVWWD